MTLKFEYGSSEYGIITLWNFSTSDAMRWFSNSTLEDSTTFTIVVVGIVVEVVIVSKKISGDV